MTNYKSLKSLHEPVLLKEVLEAFELDLTARSKKEVRIIDATLGLGGHTEAFIKSGTSVLGIEADKETLKLAKVRLMAACPAPKKENAWGKFKLILGNFRDIDGIAKSEGFESCDFILFDLGVSSLQLTSDVRGFSFRNKNAILDMRISRDSQTVKASDLLNVLRMDQLVSLFSEVMDFGGSRKLAKKIAESRDIKKIVTVGDLTEIIESTLRKGKSLNISTLPFLALRIAVNSELENLKEALPKAFRVLKRGGKLAVISFHSGEDRIVKNCFKDHQNNKEGLIVGDVIQPKREELENNNRSRSAKMRIIEKV